MLRMVDRKKAEAARDQCPWSPAGSTGNRGSRATHTTGHGPPVLFTFWTKTKLLGFRKKDKPELFTREKTNGTAPNLRQEGGQRFGHHLSPATWCTQAVSERHHYLNFILRTQMPRALRKERS